MQSTMDQNEATKALPKVLDILKKRLLTVLNQDKIETNAEDDELIKKVTEALQLEYQVNQWDDSEITECLEVSLTKHSAFNVDKYLDCAENVCDAFADKDNCYPEVYSSMEYTFTHARQFGNKSEAIFDLEPSLTNDYRKGSARLKRNASDNGIERSYTKVVLKAKQLIVELRKEYNEVKFISLNAYTTSFVLMLMRRSMKNEYDCIFYTTRVLVIEAYLTTTDEKTKNNIRETCLKYMEWYDMQMPYLFTKVLHLYGIEAGFLWDCLCSVNLHQNLITTSLINFGMEYYTKYVLQNLDPVQRQLWFPYCRLLDDNYHSKLSDKENMYICYLLVQLIEREDIFSPEELAIKSTNPQVISMYQKRVQILFTSRVLYEKIRDKIDNK